MKRTLPASVAFLALSCISGSAAVALNTVGVYDPAGANAVDTVAGLGAVTAGSPAQTSLAAYSAAFAAAFAANTGGVVNFEAFTAEVGDSTPTTNPGMTISYGITVSTSLGITRPVGNYQFDSSPTTLGTAISGTNYLRAEADPSHVFNFSTGLSMVGITALSRNSSRTISATVTYFEGGSDVISGEVVAAGAGIDDTFFGFTAPAGKTISSLTLTPTASGSTETPLNFFFAVDDLGFVVAIPEPSVALLGVAGLGLMMGRRRRA